MGHMRWRLLAASLLRSSDNRGLKFYTRWLSFTRVSSHSSLWSQRKNENALNLRNVQGIFAPSSLHSLISSPAVSAPCRSFSVAVDVQLSQLEFGNQLQAETSIEEGLTKAENASVEVGAASSEDASKRRTEKLPAEVAVQKFLERAQVIAQIVDLLTRMIWGEQLQRALRELSVTFDTPLVTQVLRVDIPCDVTLSFFHWLKSQNGFRHNEFTYGVMMNALGRVERVNEMQELFEEMKSEGVKVTSVTLSSVMLWLSRAKDARGVVRHWEKLRRAGSKPSQAIYTAYIDLLVRTERYTKIPHIYEEMLKEECLPSSRTYTLFIQHLVAAGKVEPAARILNIMQNMRVVPSRVTYELLINGYAKAGNVEKVLRLLNEMRERFHRPSKRLVPTVKALREAGRLEDVANLVGDIWPDSPLKDVSEITQIDGQSSDDDADAVDGLVASDCLMSEWRSVTCSHVGFDVNAFSQALYSWNPLVEEVLERAKVEWQSSLVLEVLRRVRDLETTWPFFHWVKNREGFKHDRYSCMLMIQRILKSPSSLVRQISMLEELFEGMMKDGLKFTVPMFNMVIRHFVDDGEVDRALDMLNRIKDFNLEPNESSYASVIQGLAKNRQGMKAMQMLQAMQDAGFQLDGVTCAELIDCLGLAGKTEKAYSLFLKMSESGRSPGELEYKAIMAMYSRVGDQKMALKLYEEMRGAGIAPTQNMYDVVSVILRKANRHLDIKAIAEQRKSLEFFGGKKKAFQESLLQVLSLFIENIKPRKACTVAAREEPCTQS